MSFASLLPQQVIVTTVTDGPVDDYGNPTHTTATSTTVGRLDRTQTTETIDGRDVTVTRDVLFLPWGVTITAASRVTVDGIDYAVDGTPSVVYGATTPHHLEVPVRALQDVA